MPHIQLEYAPNLENIIDLTALCEHLRAEAARIETFPLAGIRVRAIRADHYAMADGNPAHGFIDISLRMRVGRPMDVKKDAIARIFEAARGFLESAMQDNSIALSAELREIDADLAPKHGSVTKFMRGDA